MTTITNHPQNAAPYVAMRGSIAADPDIKIRHRKKRAESFTTVNPDAPVEPLEADWAEVHLEDHDTIIRLATRKGYRRVRVWEGDDGLWYRDGGSARLSRDDDGEYRFRIVLRRGSNQDDLEFLRGIVDRAKGGAFLRHGWRAYLDENGHPGWSYTYSRHYADAHETAFWHTTRDASPKLVVCADSRCRLEVHDALGDDHVVDEVEHEKYTIRVTRYVDYHGDDSPYAVSVACDEDLSPGEVASFSSDLQWMAATCTKANATSADPRAKGIRRRPVSVEELVRVAA